MATLKKIKPGQTLYDVKRTTGLQRFNSKYSVWPVYVHEVHEEEGYIIASWNHNPKRKYYENDVRKFRVKRPDKE